MVPFQKNGDLIGRKEYIQSLETKLCVPNIYYRQRIITGTDHFEKLTSFSNLGVVLDNRGKSKEAEKLHRRVLSTREKISGKLHLGTLDSLFGECAHSPKRVRRSQKFASTSAQG